MLAGSEAFMCSSTAGSLLAASSPLIVSRQLIVYNHFQTLVFCDRVFFLSKYTW